MKYKIKDISIKNLYVNPENARFIESSTISDEFSAIKAIVDLNSQHAVNLAVDIAESGLNPNLMPVVMENAANNKFYVMDGNRRITSIKLLTQYKNQLDNLNFTSAQKKKLLSLKCNMENIRCVVCESEQEVNILLEKLHTSNPGVTQVMWDPQAKDRHNLKSGFTSKRLAIVKMLNKSKHTTSEVKLVLSQDGWISKLERFDSDKYIFFFGIKFDPNNNILLYIDEIEVVKGLSQLVLDLQNNIADAIAQTEDVRLTYLANFPANKKPDFSKKNDPLILFDLEKETFIKSNIKNEYNEVSYDIDLSKYIGSEYRFIYTNYNNNNKFNELAYSNRKQDNKKTIVYDNTGSSRHDSNEATPYDNTKSCGKDCEEIISKETIELEDIQYDNSIDSTDKRVTLIPKGEQLPITDQRVADLYEELKLININKYVNIISISLRSLIEFSINCFLSKHYEKWAYNSNIKLIDKLKKVLSTLENKKGKKKLQSEIPAIYMWLDTYETDSSKCHFDSIAGLNILIHNHLYHPSPNELKTIYNNYSPFLKNIWDEI